MPALLFVCTANQYRSPIAAACFRKKLSDQGLEGWTVQSAGTWVEPGLPAPALTKQAVRRLGLSLGRHTTREVGADILAGSDLILVMEVGHKEALLNEFPQTREKIYLLTEMAGRPPYDIPDPFINPDSHQEIARELCNLVEQGFSRIISLAQHLHKQFHESA